MQFLSVATMKNIIVSHLEFLQMWSAKPDFWSAVDHFYLIKIPIAAFLSFL